MKPRLWKAGIAMVLLLAAFTTGFLVRGGSRDTHAKESHEMPDTSAKASEVEWWTCSMHPQVRLPEPGKCPICFMDLVPLKSHGDDEGGPGELSVSKSAAALMEIETVPAERRFVTADVRMVGKVDFDETRVSYITAWVPGRLDRLFVDYTGVSVKEGDHMVYLYSPELLSAQEELLQAIKSAKALERSEVSVIRETTEATIAAAREKLRLWGLKPEQIEEIERRGTANDHITIYAPSGGIVVHKNAQEGMYVNTGTRIYTIADLSQVWVNLDAYESDLQWLRYGQQVEFTTESYPGETFSGTISFIHPVLDEATRTVKVRMNVPNEDGRLKPGMFVRAIAKAQVATEGRIMNAALAGKWICPMHPEVVKDTAGTCDVCGMPLVRAESLGYVGWEPTEEDRPLVIPASAPLLTGKRAVVYVQIPDRDKPTFEGREIVLGPKAGDAYLVREGLTEGERVVVNGNFKLDAELQIRAKPSMMTPRDETMGLHAHPGNEAAEAAPAMNPEFMRQLSGMTEKYLALQAALAADDYKGAVESATAGLEALGDIDMSLVAGKDHADWMKNAGELKTLWTALSHAENIESVRANFALLSEQLASVIHRFGVPRGEFYKMWCPMAFDGRGASWLQESEEINNPYFGEAMLKCGEIKEVFK